MTLKLKLTIAVVVIVILILLLVLYKTHKTRDDTPDSVNPAYVQAPNKVSKIQPPADIQLNVDGASIHATWSDVAGAEEYTVYYSNQPDFTKETARTIGGIDKGEFSINKVPVGKYYFHVTSRKGKEESDWSELLSVEITACSPLDPPQNVHAKITQAADNKFTSLISWQPEMTSDGYVIRLQHGEPPKGDQTDYMVIPVKNVDANSHLLEGLEAGIKWFATVSCNGGHCGEGRKSESIALN